MLLVELGRVYPAGHDMQLAVFLSLWLARLPEYLSHPLCALAVQDHNLADARGSHMPHPSLTLFTTLWLFIPPAFLEQCIKHVHI